MAADHWGGAASAGTLRVLADELKARFREAFWMDVHEFPALAVDGSGAQVDSLGSNAGHLLWATAPAS